MHSEGCIFYYVFCHFILFLHQSFTEMTGIVQLLCGTCEDSEN